MASTRPTTIGRKPESSFEQAPAPRASMTGVRNVSRYCPRPTIPSYVHIQEPLICSGITEEDTETQRQIENKTVPSENTSKRTVHFAPNLPSNGTTTQGQIEEKVHPTDGDTAQPGLGINYLRSKITLDECSSALASKPVENTKDEACTSSSTTEPELDSTFIGGTIAQGQIESKTAPTEKTSERTTGNTLDFPNTGTTNQVAEGG